MRIYMDVCCLNRPIDDLSIGRNRLEAEAVLEIMRQIRNRTWELVGSEVVEAELSLIPSADRRAKVMSLSQLRSVSISADQQERARAIELMSMGFRYMDALHVACAESARCDVFLTTDDALVAAWRKHQGHIMIRIANPLHWIAEVMP